MIFCFVSGDGTQCVSSENDTETQGETVIYSYPKVIGDFTIA